tara:strand:- start:599 stop:1753 length:1155 start_codon:yes stop_codon:yes gene_type:complete
MPCKKCGFDFHPYCPKGIASCQCQFCNSVIENNSENFAYRSERLFNRMRLVRNKSGYDCVVPLKGDAEDYFIVSLLLKNKINPLLTLCNSYFLNDIGWHNIHNLITTFDVDSRFFNPNLNSYREFVSHTLRRVLDPKLPFRMLSYRFAFETAYNNKIPYVIHGTCGPAYYAGKFPATMPLRLSRWWTEEHDMAGSNLEMIINSGAQLSDDFSNNYLFPERKVTRKVSGIFLSNYMKWRHLKNNLTALQYGFLPEIQTSTFDCLENAGCSIHYNLHDLLRIKKYNAGKGRDHSRVLQAYHNSNADYWVETKSILSNVKLFFNKFLESSKSGYDWYYENKLKNTVANLDVFNETQCDKFKLPTWLSKSFELAVEPEEVYIFFKKGI